MPKNKKKQVYEACFVDINPRKPCRLLDIDSKYKKKISEKRKNPKNKKKKVRPKTKQEIENEEFYTPISEDEMFLSLPCRIQCTSNPWKPYWDKMVQNDITKRILSIPLFYSKLNEYTNLISLQRSFKMLAFSKIIISENFFFDELHFELNLMNSIFMKMKEIDLVLIEVHKMKVDENERITDEREKIAEYRERVAEYYLNRDLWY